MCGRDRRLCKIAKKALVLSDFNLILTFFHLAANFFLLAVPPAPPPSPPEWRAKPFNPVKYRELLELCIYGAHMALHSNFH